MSPPFRRVLVANRGEIALRIIRACRELGMEAVAVYSDADADAAHVRAADVAVRLGPAPAAESYLRADAIVAAAVATGAEADPSGLRLPGRAGRPSPRRSRRPGSSSSGPTTGRSRPSATSSPRAALAADAGVPVVPGTSRAGPGRPAGPGGGDRRPRRARIGFPLLVKAAAGGGGRGMRRVERAEDLPAALAGGAAEAASAFGDGTVYLEREVRPARHIEVQLLGDRDGTVVALGERDCSIQRRHQKLVEESPAPGLTARRAARAPRDGGPGRLRRPASTTPRPPSSCAIRTAGSGSSR